MFGGQYGPTTKRGRLLKIDLKTGETLAELVGEGGENRWAPFIHGDHVYTVLSHYLHHADFNAIGGAGDVARVGHWLYKLNKTTLAVVQKREVSCDMGLFLGDTIATVNATGVSGGVNSTTLHLRGQKVLAGQLATLAKLGMSKATEILVTGIGHDGTMAIIHADSLHVRCIRLLKSQASFTQTHLLLLQKACQPD